MSLRNLNQLYIKYFFYFLCCNGTAAKIKYKFDILTRMTAVLVTQRTLLYENHMIINWKRDLFSSKYIFFVLKASLSFFKNRLL